jgi:hypothetical protein
MRVRELQEALAKFDPELEVLAYTEDESLVNAPGHIFRLMDIEHVSEGEGERLKGRDGIPTMKCRVGCVHEVRRARRDGDLLAVRLGSVWDGCPTSTSS